jgi:hypothetical protein
LAGYCRKVNSTEANNKACSLTANYNPSKILATGPTRQHPLKCSLPN